MESLNKTIIDQSNFIEIDFSSENILTFIAQLSEERKEPFLQPLFDFVLKWFSGEDFFSFNTSGTTALSKVHTVSKKQIIASVEATGKFFQIKPKDNVLICLNMLYTGGKMMLARAIHLRLVATIIPPSNTISFPIHRQFKLTALVPSQLYAILDTPFHPLLQNVENIVVGGAPVDSYLSKKCQNLQKPAIYETFGMTETVSHIALKLLSTYSTTRPFEVLPDVEIKQSANGCLMVKARVTENEWIETKDLVEITGPHNFQWLGRIDNVVNSGGIKIYPEILEQSMAEIMRQNHIDAYFLCGVQDPRLGQKLVLVVEKPINNQTELLQKLKDHLPKYHSPHEIIVKPQFERTASGKIKRNL